MLVVSSVPAAGLAMIVIIVRLAIEIRLDGLNGPTMRPIPHGIGHMGKALTSNKGVIEKFSPNLIKSISLAAHMRFRKTLEHLSIRIEALSPPEARIPLFREITVFLFFFVSREKEQRDLKAARLAH
ncbi:hypothetical protein FBZ88_11999 [Nitrospirillum bahiense]|uniref:Uncharacterized protein n=1 Tax=Nitrospirillum amazonense TaxID=28077 RepID=A0A560FHQ6_9PROT|nr:hypothetical protein FBZ88_11999 [Nitrospirillum amazonense]